MKLLALFIVLVFVNNVTCSRYDVDEIRQILRDYDDRIHSLITNQHGLQKQVNAQADVIDRQTGVIDRLNNNVARLNSENNELKQMVQKLVKEEEKLRKITEKTKVQTHAKLLDSIIDGKMKDVQLHKNESNTSEPKADHINEHTPTASIEAKKVDSENDHKVVERPSRLLVSPSNSYVAFTATLGDHALDLGLHQTVIFERIKTNVGGAYSSDNGMFTAPEDGAYFFTASILSHYSEYLEVEITHNGNPVALIYADDSTKYEQGTNSVVLSLQAGDHVWVRTHDSNTHKVYGYNWSTFSGFRLSY